MRVIHRDLGFFVVGMTLVYGISGIVLNHLKPEKDPAYHTEKGLVQLQVGLTEDELMLVLQSGEDVPTPKRIIRKDEYHLTLFLDGGIGVYNSANGKLDYEKFKKRPLIFWFNRLHYNKVKGWSPIADFYAGSLILLAITGLFIVKGKKSIAGAGKWYLIVGILIPLIFGLLLLM